jgi:hypothetical protein
MKILHTRTWNQVDNYCNSLCYSRLGRFLLHTYDCGLLVAQHTVFLPIVFDFCLLWLLERPNCRLSETHRLEPFSQIRRRKVYYFQRPFLFLWNTSMYGTYCWRVAVSRPTHHARWCCRLRCVCLIAVNIFHIPSPKGVCMRCLYSSTLFMFLCVWSTPQSTPMSVDFQHLSQFRLGRSSVWVLCAAPRPTSL